MNKRLPASLCWLAAGMLPGGCHERGSDPASYRRSVMIESQLKSRGIRNERVLEAMQNVPRHEFVPEPVQELAYRDQPLPIGHNQTISQPFIVAYMTELINPQPEDKVLEVGTGSGYQAAVLGDLVDEVYSIELIPDLANTAKKTLTRLGYDNVHVKCGDGYKGWPEHGPYDAIVVTCGAKHTPEPLVEQLKVGGVMIIPVGPNSDGQELRLITKVAEGKTRVRDVIPVRFVPLRRAEDVEDAESKER